MMGFRYFAVAVLIILVGGTVGHYAGQWVAQYSDETHHQAKGGE